MKKPNIPDTAHKDNNHNTPNDVALDTSNNLNDTNNQNVMETNNRKAMETNNPNMTDMKNSDIDNKDKDLILRSEEETARVKEYLRRLEELPPVPTHDPNIPLVTEPKDSSGPGSANQNESTRLVEDVDNTMSDFMSHYFSSNDDDDDTMAKSIIKTYDTSYTNIPNSNNDTLFDILVPLLSNIVKEDKEEIY
jgi:hypothetical protein